MIILLCIFPMIIFLPDSDSFFHNMPNHTGVPESYLWPWAGARKHV